MVNTRVSNNTGSDFTLFRMAVSSELSHWLTNGAELTTELDRKSLQLEFDELLLSYQLKSNQLTPRQH